MQKGAEEAKTIQMNEVLCISKRRSMQLINLMEKYSHQPDMRTVDLLRKIAKASKTSNELMFLTWCCSAFLVHKQYFVKAAFTVKQGNDPAYR